MPNCQMRAKPQIARLPNLGRVGVVADLVPRRSMEELSVTRLRRSENATSNFLGERIRGLFIKYEELML